MQGRETPKRTAVLVCVARVMDPSSAVDFAALLAGRAPVQEPEAADLSWILNPADEAAVRFAVEGLRQANEAIGAVHVGPPSGEPTLREALAAGADHGARLELPAEEPVQAAAVAEALAAYCRQAGPDWVLVGQSTLDWGTGLVGPMLAELLGLPYVDNLIEVARDGSGAVTGLRVVGKGVREEIRVTGPAVLAVSPLAFRPLTPPVPARMRARRATIPVEVTAPAGQIVRPVAAQATRPRPRPKASLPPDFSSMSVEERLAFLSHGGQKVTKGTRWIEGEARDVARQILDCIEEFGCDWTAN